jgi:Na+/proline symporter
MSIDDPRQLRTSAWVATLWNTAMATGAIAVGLVGRVYYPTAAALPAGDTENLYPLLAQQHLHPVVFGVVVASIFAAIMSTADSQLLVAASALVRDLYQGVLKGGAAIPEERLVQLSRASLVGLVLASLAFGFVAEDLVFWLVLFAWAGLGAALGPTSILAIFWRGTTRAGVFAGMLTGAATTVVWYYTPALKSLIYELVPAFIAGLLATVAVSIMTKAPEATDDAFDAMGTDNEAGRGA